MFSINFTKAQAEQYIKERLASNFINVPEFTVIISDVESTKEATEESSGNALEVNPWLIPDADGWFTHDPEWKVVDCPPYITGDRKVFVILHDYNSPNDDGEFADSWNWYVDGDNDGDILKWKYVD